MFRLLLFSSLSLCSILGASAQNTYKDSLLTYRQHYKNEFITEPRSPLKGTDTAYLRFFKADASFRVTARVDLTPEAPPFNMPTHSGKTKKFRQYGVLHFKLNNKDLQLQVFQNLSLPNTPGIEDHLFVPFTDKTSYKLTYAGGRYIDLSKTDIKDNMIVLDFNKCYNPYCAYADGYNCPIPPTENRLPVAINAGEMMFAKPQKKTH